MYTTIKMFEENYKLVFLWNTKKIHHKASGHNLGMGVESKDDPK